MHPVNPMPAPYFNPMPLKITSITNANPAVVTTAAKHNLQTGEAVRLIIPRAFGMTSLNNQVFSITVLSPTTYSLQRTLTPSTVNVDTTQVDAFVVPAGKQSLAAQSVPIGSLPSINTAPLTYFDTKLTDQVLNTLKQAGGSQ